jgi:hypothetical protein
MLFLLICAILFIRVICGFIRFNQRFLRQNTGQFREGGTEKEKCGKRVGICKNLLPRLRAVQAREVSRGVGKIRLMEREPVMAEAFRGSGKSTFFTLLDPVMRSSMANAIL